MREREHARLGVAVPVRARSALVEAIPRRVVFASGGMVHKSSHELPRIFDGQGPRILRLRAGERFLGRIRLPPDESGGGAIEILSRERVLPGDRVHVEISFGPMADEIILSGVVNRIQPRGVGEAPLVVIQIVRTHAHRVRYVKEVMDGERVATARSHRRTATNLAGRWWWGLEAHPTSIGELSRGGTFITASRAPAAGFRFDLEIRPDPRIAPIRVPSRVVWVSAEDGRRGFGASFVVDDIVVANQLASLVRAQEAVAPAW